MAPSLTFDEALTRHVGQFGPGQWWILSASSLCLIANAAAFFFWTLAAGNPVLGHAWECVQPTDSSCQAIKQQEAPSKQDFCALPAGSTLWTSQGGCGLAQACGRSGTPLHTAADLDCCLPCRLSGGQIQPGVYRCLEGPAPTL